jgi:hypothetical protein
LGNGSINDIFDVIYVKTDNYKPKNNVKIAAEIGQLNDKLQKENRPYLLIGSGRWGSQDASLGIPVSWGQISGVRAIVETGMKDYNVEPSQGTHFFQNLTSLHIPYITVNEYISKGKIKMNWFENQNATEETEHLRHIRLAKPLEININGVDGRASITNTINYEL